MSITQLKRTASIFYWAGVSMTVGCVAAVVVTHSAWIWRFGRRDFPLPWVFAGLAIVAFLATELCHSVLHRPEKAADQDSQPVLPRDKNDKISKQEFMRQMEAEFDRLDEDKNGELAAEARSAFQVHQIRGG